MLLIPCPWCGERDEIEFSYGGEAHIVRPKNPDALDDAAWADYVFMRKNPKGLHYERWVHIHGCRRWFNVARDTVTHEIRAVYRMGEKPPSGKGGRKRATAASGGAKKPAAKKAPKANGGAGRRTARKPKGGGGAT